MPKKVYTAFIADDEKSSREIMQDYILRYCKDIEVIGMAEDARQAVKGIQKLQPDLVFLDVEMPFGNAFDVMEQTASLKFETIFVTAFDTYAIKALNYSAAYYILKPVAIDELITSVEKAIERINNRDTGNLREVLKENLKQKELKRIVLPNQDGYEVLNTAEIIRVEGNGNYSDIYLQSGKKKTVSKVLKFFSGLEDNREFLRVHRSHIVNTSFIKAYRKGRGGILMMSDGSEVEVAASKKQEVLEVLGVV